MVMADNKEEFLTYKGKPLVRCGDTIYYGDMNDEFVAMLQIVSKKMVENEEVADKIKIQIISTNEELNPLERVIKHGEKSGLFNSLDLADVWLQRALTKKA